MKTSTVEVGELFSTLSAAGVERQLSTLPGVHHADVNYVIYIHFAWRPAERDGSQQMREVNDQLNTLEKRA